MAAATAEASSWCQQQRGRQRVLLAFCGRCVFGVFGVFGVCLNVAVARISWPSVAGVCLFGVWLVHAVILCARMVLHPGEPSQSMRGVLFCVALPLCLDIRNV